MLVEIKFIGRIRSVFKHISECPKQPTHDLEPSELIIDGDYLDAAHGLKVGDEIYVFTWLNKADRGVLRCHPRGDRFRPKKRSFCNKITESAKSNWPSQGEDFKY